jgi:hypothetical protein
MLASIGICQRYFSCLSFCRPFILELDEHGALVGFLDLNITSFSIGFDVNLEPEDPALDDVIDDFTT